MTRFTLITPIVLLGLAGCANLPFGAGSGGPASAAPPRSPLSGPSASAASLDTVSEAEKAAARQAAAAAPAGGVLGQETVSLGSPTEQGLWVKSELVRAEGPGTVRTGSGDAIAVTLRPLDGVGGAQISLSALQALGLPLAGLHPVTLATAG